jgi:hypothetical protein
MVANLVYDLSFKGNASDMLRAEFGEFKIKVDRGVTHIRATLPDRSALYGLIGRLDALGLELLDVRLVAEPERF